MIDNKETIHYLLCNKWRCKDGTILISKHKYDFVSHIDSNGEFSFVDGGTSGYIRHSGNMESICVYTNDPHELIRESFGWISYGINGDEPAQYNLLKDLSSEHIKAILKTQKHLPEYMKKVFSNELTYRKLNKE